MRLLLIEYAIYNRTFEQVKRHSVGMVFSECKERFLLNSPQSALGMIRIRNKQKNMLSYSHDDSASKFDYSMLTVNVDDNDYHDYHGTTGIGIDAISPKISPHSVARSRYLGNPSAVVLARHSSFDSQMSVSSTLPLTAVDVDGDAAAFDEVINILKKDDPVPGTAGADDAEDGITAAALHPFSTSGSGRVSRTAGGNNDKDSKTNIKKEWQNIYKQASEYLLKSGSSGGASGPGSRGHNNATGTASNSNNISGNNSKQQLEEADVMSLLVTAASLPTYINAPGECFAETVRAAVGELMLQCAASQSWALDVRDSLYDAVYPPVTLTRLRALETEGLALKIVHKELLSNYRFSLKEHDDINKAIDQLKSSLSHTDPNSEVISDQEVNSIKSMTLTEARELLQRARSLPRAAALHSKHPFLETIVTSAEQLTADVNDCCALRSRLSGSTGKFSSHMYTISYKHVDAEINMLIF